MFSTLRSLSELTHFAVLGGHRPKSTLLQRYIFTRSTTRLFTSSTPIKTVGGIRGPSDPSDDEPQTTISDVSTGLPVSRAIAAPRYDDPSPQTSTCPSSSRQADEFISTHQVRLLHLPLDVDEQKVRDFFASCGRLLSVDIWTDADGRPTGRGYATFVEVADAQAALALDRGLLLGRKIRVMAVRPLLPSTTLSVSDIPHGTQEHELREFFSEPTPLWIYFPSPGDVLSHGFVRVEYRTVEEAEHAQKIYHRAMLGGRPLDVYFMEFKRDKLDRKQNAVPSGPPSETLFVGNLHRGATESDVENIFTEFHPVRVFIARGTSGEPLGSAQVEFRSVDDAQRALEAFTQKRLFGRLLRVHFVTRQPLYPPHDRLFVANMQWNVTTEDLQDIFAEFEPVAFFRQGDSQGRPYPYAYVKFRSTEEAQLAQEACNKKELLGRPLAVRFAAPESSGQWSPEAGHDIGMQMRTTSVRGPAVGYQIRVENMPPNASVRAITEFFATCGTVLSVSKRSNELEKSKGCVYVTLADSNVGKQAAAALALDGSFFQGERIRIIPLSQSQPATTLWIKNMAYSVTARDLWELLVFPEPLAVHVPRGRTRGIAYVQYRTAQEAQQARDKYNRTVLAGSRIHMFFRYDGREQRARDVQRENSIDP